MSVLRAARPPARPWRRRIILTLVGLLALGVLDVVGLNVGMVWYESAQVYTMVAAVPPRPVALVLGAGPGSLYFEDRLDAAADLYKAGKVRHLLVSGAGDGEPGFTETDLMRTGLIQRHVPAAAITCDEAGVRTLDSMARAKLVFGVDSVVIVSQSFHLPRAIFLAHHWGLDAVGFAAADPGGDFMDTKGREWLARVLAVADTTITHRQPRTLGPPQPIQLTMPDAASPALVHGIN